MTWKFLKFKMLQARSLNIFSGQSAKCREVCLDCSTHLVSELDAGRLRHLKEPESVRGRNTSYKVIGSSISQTLSLLTGSLCKDKDHFSLHPGDCFRISQLCKFPGHLVDILTLLLLLKGLGSLEYSQITSLLT